MSSILNALAEPNRLRIVELLRLGPLSVGEIAVQLELKQPQASKHLKSLYEAGLVEMESAANKRIYRLKTEPFQEIDNWVRTFRHLWEQRFERIDAYLFDLQNRNKPDIRD